MRPEYAPPPGAGYLPPPPSGPTAEPIRPSAWWFGVAAVATILGIVVAVVVIVRAIVGVVDEVDDYERVDVPGRGTVTLTETGDYTIFHEYPGADVDEGRFAPELDSVTLTAPDGSDVRLEPYSSTETYSFPGHESVAAFDFNVTETGDYQLAADGEPATLAVGKGIRLGRLVRSIIIGVLVGGLGVVAGIVIATIVGVGRSRARTRQMVRTGPPGGMPPPGAYGPPAWPQR